MDSIQVDAKTAVRPWGMIALIAAVVFLTAAWLAFTPSLSHFDSDRAVSKLASTMHWSFFYWESDRLGQLIPLLAMPVQDPLSNSILQAFLGICFSALAFFLVAIYVTERRQAFAVGAVALGSYLWFAPGGATIIFLEGIHTYGPGMCMATAALLLARPLADGRFSPLRLALALVLSWMSIWMNMGSFCWASGLLGAQALMIAYALRRDAALEGNEANKEEVHNSYKQLAWSSGVGFTVLVCGLMIAMIARKFLATDVISPWSKVSFSFVSLGHYPKAVLNVFVNGYVGIIGWHATIYFLIVIVLGAVLIARKAWPRGATVLILCALGFTFFFAGMSWVAMNGYHAKYFLTSFVTFYCYAAVVVVAAYQHFAPKLANSWIGEKLSATLLIVFVFSALWINYGLPSLKTPQATLSSYGSPYAESIVDSDVNYVAGDYWAVWPVVFKANYLLAQRGESRRIWGIGYRASETRGCWEDVQKGETAKVAYLKNAPQQYGYSLQFFEDSLRLRFIERVDSNDDYDVYTFKLAEHCRYELDELLKQPIEFGLSESAGGLGEGRACLLTSGWHSREADGVWSKDESAKIRLAVNDVPNETLSAEISLSSYTGMGFASIPQDVTIRVGDRVVDTLRFEPRDKFKTVAFEIEPSDWSQEKSVLLSVDCNTINPSREGISVETRDLGVYLGQLNLTTASAVRRTASHETDANPVR